jgi:hypothetical protein
MATPALEEIQHDDLAVSIARALVAANDAAVARGIDLAASLVTVSEESPPPNRVWQVHYGSREYVHRRGGDLIVLVEEQTGNLRRIIRGQ